jgi:hypothetical protein
MRQRWTRPGRLFSLSCLENARMRPAGVDGICPDFGRHLTFLTSVRGVVWIFRSGLRPATRRGFAIDAIRAIGGFRNIILGTHPFQG